VRGRIFLASLRPYPPLSPVMVCRAPHKTAGGFIDTKQILNVGWLCNGSSHGERGMFLQIIREEREGEREREREAGREIGRRKDSRERKRKGEEKWQ